MAVHVFPDEDLALIEPLQRAAFGYFDDFTNDANGLVADTSDPGAPCSIAAVGFGLTALAVGVERGWIERDRALSRALVAARFFDAEQTSGAPDAISKRGFYFHFLDMQSGRRVWRSEISVIDTAILSYGLLTAAACFEGAGPDESELRERVEAVIDALDWAWMLDRHGRLRMGWKPEHGFLRHHWHGYSEALLAYALGLGAEGPGLPPEAYQGWRDSFQWSGDAATGYVHAGQLFIHLFAHCWLDLTGVGVGTGGIDYVENSRRAIAAQRAYAEANPGGFLGYGKDVWGLSACLGPDGRHTLHDGRRMRVGGYVARAVPYGPDDGTLAPWGPPACLPLAPEAALSGLRALLEGYPGAFRDGRPVDAFNPGIRPGIRKAPGWYSSRTTALDQGLLVAMIENARTGLIHRLLAKSKPVMRAMEALRGQTGP